MSYILDALTHADRKRNRAQVPTIQSVHQTGAGTGAATAPRRLFLLLAGIIALATVCYALVRGGDPVATANRPEIAASSPPNLIGSKPAIALNRTEDKVPPKVETESVARASQTLASTQPARVASSRSATSDSSAAQGNTPVTKPATSQPTAAQPRDLDKGAQHALVPAATAADGEQAPPEVALATAATAPREAIPLLEDLPPEFRNSLPPLSINAHVYAEDPTARMVIINMRRYRQGDNTAEGLTIERITDDGVTVAYAEQTFRLRR
jgi:general secretion pathway protein B